MHPIIESLEADTKKAFAKLAKSDWKKPPKLPRMMAARHETLKKMFDFNGNAQLIFEARTWQAGALGLQSVEIPSLISKVTNYKFTQTDGEKADYPTLYNHHKDQYEESWRGSVKRYLGRNVIHPLFMWKKKTTIEIQHITISHFDFANRLTDEIGERFRLLEQSKLFNSFSVLHSVRLQRSTAEKNSYWK